MILLSVGANVVSMRTTWSKQGGLACIQLQTCSLAQGISLSFDLQQTPPQQMQHVPPGQHHHNQDLQNVGRHNNHGAFPTAATWSPQWSTQPGQQPEASNCLHPFAECISMRVLCQVFLLLCSATSKHAINAETSWDSSPDSSFLMLQLFSRQWYTGHA